jgi:hypothetical protein
MHLADVSEDAVDPDEVWSIDCELERTTWMLRGLQHVAFYSQHSQVIYCSEQHIRL